MALAAILPEAPQMAVVFLVAIITGAMPQLVVAVDVTRYARNRLVLASKREPTVVEVLTSWRVEVQKRRVALGAIRSKFAFVLVLVAIDTIELARAIDTTRVAANTVGLEFFLAVEPGQGELGVKVVIERLVALPTLDVTAGTRLVTELPLVGIPMSVAIRTSAVAVLEFDLSLVTAGTGLLAVLTEQWKAEFSVIDASALEWVGQRVACCTIGRGFGHRVRRRMAIHAGRPGHDSRSCLFTPKVA